MHNQAVLVACGLYNRRMKAIEAIAAMVKC